MSKKLLSVLFLAVTGLAAVQASDRLLPCEGLTGLLLNGESLLLSTSRGALLEVGVDSFNDESAGFACDNSSFNWRQVALPQKAGWTSLDNTDDGRRWLLGHQKTLLRQQKEGAWQKSLMDEKSPQAFMDILKADFLNGEQSYFLVGTRGLFMRSEDGRRWSRETLFIDPEWDEPEDYNVNAILQLRDRGLLAAGEAGVIYWSLNGEEWRKDNAGTDATWFTGLALAEGGALLAGFGGAVAYVSGYEDDWQSIPNPASQSLFSIEQLDNGDVLLGGTGGSLLLWNAKQPELLRPIASETEATIMSTVYSEGRLIMATSAGLVLKSLP